MADTTLAVAGHALNSTANIESLVTDWLRLGAPDDEGLYSRPANLKVRAYVLLTDGEVPAGLKPALRLLWAIEGATIEIVTDRVTGDIAKWAKEADAVHEVDDPIATLISLLSQARSPRLLINWEESDADDEALIKAAHSADSGIRVLDLVEGLVEIAPDEDDEPEPEPEPEETRPRRATRPRPQEIEETREELEEVPPASEKPQEAAQEVQQEAVQLTVPAQPTYTVERELLEAVFGALTVAADYHNYLDCMDALRAGKALDKAARGPLTQELANTAELVRQVIFEEVPYTQTVADKPAKPSPDKPVKVIWDDDAKEWKRAGRGRVRAGTRVGMMDSAGNVTEV